jgi:long-subunit acyl-CoA synthetase (AMP-forming)
MLEWAKTIPSVKHIIVWGCNSNQEGNNNNEDDDLPPGKGDRFVTYEDCLKASADADPIISSPPKPEDLAIIMYTSGTT